MSVLDPILEEFLCINEFWYFLEAYFRPLGMTRCIRRPSSSGNSYYITCYNPEICTENERLVGGGKIDMYTLRNPERLSYLFKIRISDHISTRNRFDLDILLSKDNFAIFENGKLI